MLKKKKTFSRKETLKEVRKSISKARDEHRRNMEQINQINDSVKYSPQRSIIMNMDNLNQKSIDTCDDNDNGAVD